MNVMLVRLSEPLGSQQSVGEVEQQPRGHERGERVIEIHETLLQAIAGVGVTHRHREKAKPHGQHEQVHHLDIPSGLRSRMHCSAQPQRRASAARVLHALCERTVRGIERHRFSRRNGSRRYRNLI